MTSGGHRSGISIRPYGASCETNDGTSVPIGVFKFLYFLFASNHVHMISSACTDTQQLDKEWPLFFQSLNHYSVIQDAKHQ